MANGCLREGTYRLALTSPPHSVVSDAVLADETGLAVLRGGQIVGSGRWGGVFHGSLRYDDATGLNHIHVTLEVPPERCLVTGFCAGREGVLLDIVGAVRCDGRQAATVVEVGGAPLEVALTYLAPPPG